MFELPNLHLRVVIVCVVLSREIRDQDLPRNRFILMTGSKTFSLSAKQSTSSRFPSVVCELLLLVQQVQELQVNAEGL